MLVSKPDGYPIPHLRDNLSSSQLAPEDEREAQRVEMEEDDKEIQKKESQRDEEDDDYMCSQESSQESWSGSSQSTEKEEDGEIRWTLTHEHDAEEDEEEKMGMRVTTVDHNEGVPLFLPGSEPDKWDLPSDDQPSGSSVDWPENLKKIRKKLTKTQLESIVTAMAQPEISDEAGKALVIETIAILYKIKWRDVEQLVNWLGRND